MSCNLHLVVAQKRMRIAVSNVICSLLLHHYLIIVSLHYHHVDILPKQKDLATN